MVSYAISIYFDDCGYFRFYKKIRQNLLTDRIGIYINIGISMIMYDDIEYGPP